MNTQTLIRLLTNLNGEFGTLMISVGKLRLLKMIFRYDNKKDWNCAIDEVLNTLPERYKKILELRFGLLDGLPRTLEYTAQQFGVTRERIRQMEAKALRMLGHSSRRKVLIGLNWQQAVQELKTEGISLLKENAEKLKSLNNPILTEIEEIGLPTRIVNSLRQAKYQYAEELDNLSDDEIRKVRNIGITSVGLIRKCLKNKTK